MHTACVVGKNYRLQDIQLSKRRCSLGLSPQRISSQSIVLTASNFQQALRLVKPGGEYRARTGDLLVANQALSQLS